MFDWVLNTPLIMFKSYRICYNFIVSCSNCFENFVVIVSDSVGFAREILATLQKMLSTKGSLLGWLRQQENSSYQDNSFKDLKWLIVWYMQAAILQKLNYKKFSALSPFVISDHVEFKKKRKFREFKPFADLHQLIESQVDIHI